MLWEQLWKISNCFIHLIYFSNLFLSLSRSMDIISLIYMYMFLSFVSMNNRRNKDWRNINYFSWIVFFSWKRHRGNERFLHRNNQSFYEKKWRENETIHWIFDIKLNFSWIFKSFSIFGVFFFFFSFLRALEQICNWENLKRIFFLCNEMREKTLIVFSL